jgi:predicted amino acid-binding ACT domain protein
MAMDVSRVDVWVAGMKDKPGALADKLAALADAGANLAFVLARRAPDKPGTGVVFLAPLSGRKQLAAAKKAGFHKSRSLHSVRVQGTDKPGLGAAMTEALADAGINLRGLSATTIGRRCAVYFAFDTTADAAKAARVLKKL